MKIQRKAIESLLEWKNRKSRKPLILQGARQVGKTWLLKEFGTSHFKDVAVFNFDENPELKQFFASTKDIKRIIDNLSLVHGKTITTEDTLIIFDEIQECNDALNTLKYFCEDAPEYFIACAGSLLGVAMSRGASFPVGKVDFLPIYPVSFLEFLEAADVSLYNYLLSIHKIEPIPDLFFNQLLDKFKMYYISGGMPEAVVELIENKDTAHVQRILQNILNAYVLDFSKHAENSDVTKIGYIWQSLPSQLARDNKKFLYQTVKPGARARDYENALQWLVNAGLIYLVNRSTKPELPLSAYDDLSAFKIYSLDVGLLRRLAGLAPSAIAEGNRLLTEFKGALTENYILESLIGQFENAPRYWTSGNRAEVDFILQLDNEIIPIEVKSDENVTGKSLTFYRKEFDPKVSIRYSLKNLKQDDGLINIPLFMADMTDLIIKLSK
ncbi:MAG: AAA family ATPase [Tannerellaceae bacterium]